MIHRNPHIVVLGSGILARTITQEILATLATFPNRELLEGKIFIVEIRDENDTELERLKTAFEQTRLFVPSLSDQTVVVPKKITGSFPSIFPVRTKRFLFWHTPCFHVNRNKGPPNMAGHRIRNHSCWPAFLF